MIKNLEIYVFDMGNVITKPTRLDMVYKEAKMKCTYSDFRRKFYHSEESDKVYRGIISDDEFFEYIRNECQTDNSANELKDLYTKGKNGIYQETKQIIEELKNKGNNIYLLSNLKQVDYDYLNSNFDLTLFDQLFLSYKIGMSKPHEDIYQYVIETLGTNNFHFFDDSEENINAAKKLGINTYLTTGQNIEKCFKLIKQKR